MDAATTIQSDMPANRLPFLALFAANTVSLVGNGITALAIPWFVLQTTGSASRMGMVAAAGLIPFIMASVVGGTAVDRVGHKQASILADLVSGLTVAAIPLVYHTVGLPFWALLLLVFSGALLDAPGNAARASLIPDLAALGRISLERANGASQATTSLATLLGPALAGLLIAALGSSTVLWIDAGTFAFSALVVAVAVPSHTNVATVEKNRYLDDVMDGLRVLWNDRLLRGIAVTAAVTNAATTPIISVVLPVMARRTYGDVQALGTIVAALGAGSLGGALAYGTLGDRFPRRLAMAFSFTFASLPLWILILEPPVIGAALALLVVGIGSGIINPLVMTVFQERVAAEYRARVFGALIALAMVAAPAGVLVTGPLVEALGVKPILAGIAGVMLLVSMSTFINSSFREMDDVRSSVAGRAQAKP